MKKLLLLILLPSILFAQPTDQEEPDYCGGVHFYDSGGASGTYQDSENRTTIIFPDNAGERIKAVFNVFQLEACCDYLQIYNGPDATFPLLFRGNGSASPGTQTSTHVSGALTFVFTSDSSITYSGWDATIICEPMPACPNPPTDISMINATTNGATIQWTDTSGALSWQVETVLQGQTPMGAGETVASNPYQIIGLESNTCYDFYVRSVCTDGTSEWAGPISFCTQPDYCAGDHFYDSGGANGQYQNNENQTTVIFPNVAGNRVKAVFNSFQLENCCDYLSIYNGPDATFPLLFAGNGINSPGTKSSTHASGALTFVFTSDNSITRNGWDALILCEPMPDCPNPPTNITLINATTSAATIQWTEGAESLSWQVETVVQGQTPTGIGTIVTANPYELTGLETNTCYQFYVRSLCNNGTSDWVGPFLFCTQPDYCGGDRFYDSGGLNGSYQNNENRTTVIFPDVPGNRVRAVFNSFQLENCCDYLRIYNGPDATFPLLFTGNGINSPGTKASTHATGALTFVFTSDSSGIYSGWDASILCEEMPACPDPPSNLALVNATTSSATIQWTNGSGLASWQVETVLQGQTPTGIGTEITSNPYQINGLETNTCYQFYVRGVCTDGTSEWVGPFSFCTQPDYCSGDHFYDTGGANGHYQNNENKTTVIFPDVPGNRVRAVFNSFQLESCCDYLRIYNGPDATFPLLFSGNGNISPGTQISTHVSGALTFVFTSDNIVNYAGWDATIICEPVPLCSNQPTALYANNINTISATVGWTESSGATAWELEIVLRGEEPSALGIATNENPFTLSSLESNTCYDFYVRSICGDETSTWSGPLTFCTQPDYCGGDHFYDTGGANNNYLDNENKITVIYPENPGSMVSATFHSFQMESCCDYFSIFNGPDNSYPLLFTGSGTTSPGTVTSTDVSGALTFLFRSDGGINYSGWDATINCQDLAVNDSEVADFISYHPNPVEDVLTINAKSNIVSYAIYDINSRLISNHLTNAAGFSIELKDYSAGAYFVKLFDNEGKTYNLKILKK